MPTATADPPVLEEPAPPPAVDDGACLQCGAERVGPFCHACGQHESVADGLTFRSLWNDFRVRRLSLDRGLFLTITHVLVRPGVVARAFVEGQRQTYTHPIPLLFVLYAAYAVIFSLIDEPFQAMMRGQVEAQMPVGEGLSPEMEMAMSVMAEAMRVFYSYGAYFSALIIFPFALLLRWLLGDRGRTVAEYAVLGAYVEAAVVIPSALLITPLSVATRSTGVGMLSLALYLAYAAWGVAQFLGDRRPGTLGLSVLSMTVALGAYLVLFFALAFAVGIYVGFQGAHAGAF